MIIFVFFNLLVFCPFPWQRQPFWKKNQPLAAEHHMAYDIPTRFHKDWSRHLREIERTKMCGRIIIIRIIITRFDCVWMQTQNFPSDTHFRIRVCGCKFHHYQQILHFIIFLDINVHLNRRPLTIWRPANDIKSQHRNLLGNQISSKSEYFCILAAMLDSKCRP